MKYCTRCGNELKDDDIFCGKCGYKQDSHTTENNLEELKNLNQNDNSNLDSKDNPPKDKGRKKEKGPRKRIHAKSVWALIFAILCLITRGAALISLFFGFMAVLFILLDLIFHGKKRTRNHVLAFIALGIILFNLIGINIIKNKATALKSQENDWGDIQPVIYTYSDEELKNTESDIDGLSLFDKLEMGLEIYDESDSDKDGLTDKEEIEIYNTDPLQVSTSGDLIPDSYKTKMGLDYNTKYNIEDFSFEDYGLKPLYNAPDNISIDKTDVNNAFASIYERERYYYGEQSVIGFDFVDVSGEISVDFSNYLTDDIEYTVVIQKDGNDIEKTDLLEDNEMCFSTLSDADFINISVFEKAKIIGYDEALFFSWTGIIGMISDISDWDIKNGIFPRNIYIFERSDNPETEDRSQALSEIFENAFETDNIIVHHKYLSSTEFFITKTVYDLLFTPSDLDEKFFSIDIPKDNPEYPIMFFFQMLFNRAYVYQYLNAAEWNFSEPATVSIKFNELSSESILEIISISLINQYKNMEIIAGDSKGRPFDLYNDTFEFGNNNVCHVLPNNQGGEGVCSGFAYVTAARFNEEIIERKYNYTAPYIFIDLPYEYDLKDEMYNPIFNRDLSLRNGIIAPNGNVIGYFCSWDKKYETVEDVDQNVRNLLQLYWAKWNDVTRSDLHSVKKHYKSELVELEKYISKGNVAIADVSGNSSFYPSCAHSINIYGIRKTVDPDIMYLLVYDNNIPCNFNKEKYKEKVFIKTMVYKDFDGNERYKFFYDGAGCYKDEKAYSNFLIDVDFDKINFYRSNYMRIE